MFKYKFNIIPLLNPLIWDDINCMKNLSGINNGDFSHLKRENKIIVSLTSYRERFKKLPITIYSLLNQTLKPDKIILWIDNETEDLTTIPYEITRFIKNGLEIRFVKDIKSYTKVIYTFKEYPDSIIVTADDDIYYRKNWLRKLYHSYIAHTEDIHVHRAHRILINNGSILPYEQWNKHTNEETARYDNFLTGVGGVLYPPNCFTKEVLREDIFLKYAPNADDIWFWVMALTNNRKIRVVKNHYKNLILTDFIRHFSKNNLYSKNRNGGNDKQLKNLMKFYGQNIINKL